MSSLNFANGTDLKRFMAKIKINSDGCWIWTAGCNPQGYGIFRVKTIMTQLAHRISYLWEHGEISNILTIDHICAVRPCVNPDHLRQVSLVENCMRGNGWGATNKRKTKCPKGHLLAEGNLVECMLPARRECKICHNARSRERFNDHDPNWTSQSGHNAEKTHCSRGHPFTEDNLVKSAVKNRARRCLTCHNDTCKKTREKYKNGTAKKKPIAILKTHCKNGHALIDENLLKLPSTIGIRRCLICYKIRNKQSTEKAKLGIQKKNPNHWAAKKTHCKRGHELTEANRWPKDIVTGVRRCKSCMIDRRKADKSN